MELRWSSRVAEGMCAEHVISSARCETVTTGVADDYEWMHMIWAHWMIENVYQLGFNTSGLKQVIAWAPDGTVIASPL